MGRVPTLLSRWRLVVCRRLHKWKWLALPRLVAPPAAAAIAAKPAAVTAEPAAVAAAAAAVSGGRGR